MNHITPQKVLGALLAVFIPGTLLSLFIDPDVMFHWINPAAIAMGCIVVMTYWGGLTDAWKNRLENITPGHILTFGIMLNWTGLIIRMGRWLFTNVEPSGDPLEFGIYNFGLWMSIWAGLFLVNAASLVTRPIRPATLLVIFFVIVTFLYWADYTNIFVFN